MTEQYRHVLFKHWRLIILCSLLTAAASLWEASCSSDLSINRQAAISHSLLRCDSTSVLPTRRSKPRRIW